MSADIASRPARADPARHSRGLRVSAVWLLVCLLVVLWWTVRYASVMAWLAEWQFAHLGRYYPTATLVILILVLTAPIAAAIGWWRGRRRRRAERDAGAVDPVARMAAAIAGAMRACVFFLAVAAVAALVTLGVLLTMLSLPDGDGPVRPIAGTDRAVQPEGPARYPTGFAIGRVARIEENAGLARRVMYVAPVRLAGGSGGIFLTEVDRLPPPGLRFRPIPAGVLVARGLPRELSYLYRAVDVSVPDNAYLLMRDGATVRWRPIVLAVQTGLLALVTLGIALLLRRQARRLRATVASAADGRTS